MKFLNGLKQIDLLPERVVATVGNFDGVHRGHQALLVSLREKAAQLGCPSLVILFEPQPCEYFLWRDAPARLMGLREKLHALRDAGIDYVCCLKFNVNFAQMTAAHFAEHVIFKSLRVVYLLTGSDFRFGRDRMGDVDLLIQLGKHHGCDVEAYPDFMGDGVRISSTGIRQALQQANFTQATSSLGRPYSICGRVIVGDGRGRQWGIPTANVLLHRESLPLSGVFSVCVKLKDQLYDGVANIGRRPTIDGSLKLSLEVHLFEFTQSIYGEFIHVLFKEKLRDEKKFDSVDELIKQIRQDIERAKYIAV